MICEKCGHEMQYFNEYSTQGWKCPECGWGVATTYIDPMHEDDNIYEIIISSENEVSKEAISLLKGSANLTTPEAIKLLKTGNYVFFTGKASSVMEKKSELESAGVKYEIIPDFPWRK